MSPRLVRSDSSAAAASEAPAKNDLATRGASGGVRGYAAASDVRTSDVLPEVEGLIGGADTSHAPALPFAELSALDPHELALLATLGC